MGELATYRPPLVPVDNLNKFLPNFVNKTIFSKTGVKCRNSGNTWGLLKSFLLFPSN